MKDLTHQNINTFIGACVEPGNICILSQYCAKGSLQVTKNLQNPALKCCSTSTLHIYIEFHHVSFPKYYNITLNVT